MDITQVAKAAACAGVGMAAAPWLAAPVLGLVGFSAAGPVAGGLLFVAFTAACTYGVRRVTGGIAAGIQAGMGNVAAGSLFAGAQAVAMGGSLPAIGYAGAAAVAGAAGTVGTWLGVI